MNRLVDVDVSGVHLVGSPANHRPFALFKSTAGTKPEETDSMKLTTAEFKKRFATVIEGDFDDTKLQAFAKNLGIELTETPAAKVKTEKTVDPTNKDEDDGALEKSLSAPQLIAAIEKANKPLLDQIAALQKANDEAAKIALGKRVTVLKSAGYELDETVTEAEVSALEKGHAMVVKAAERVGLTKAFGSADAEEPTSGGAALQLMVDKQVTAVLGRTPMNKAEAARIKQEIYRANPGLLTAIVKAERDARVRAAS